MAALDGVLQKQHLKRERPGLGWRIRKAVHNTLFWARGALGAKREEHDPMSGTPTPIPKTVICIMDGNGRYGERRNMPRSWGHLQGVENARRVLKALDARGVAHAGLWLASPDNLTKRSPEEMRYLVKLLKDELRRRLAEPEQIRVRFCGDWQRYVEDPELAELIKEIEATTAKYRYRSLTLFFGYGGHDDIRHAMKRIARDYAASSPRDFKDFLTDEAIQERLMSHWVDGEGLLIIRTGEPEGQAHTSDFLLWQLPQAQWHFTSTLWPEFDVPELDRVLDSYGSCARLGGAPRT